MSKAFAWLKIARLQFYPMAWIAYGLGATLALRSLGVFYKEAFFAGLACIFLLELCTVLINEYFDHGTDVRNKNASLFSGGSRVLVEGRLSFGEVRVGIITVLFLFVLSSAWLFLTTKNVSTGVLAFVLLLGLFLGVGYTAPPLKFSYRGIGELVVSFTHSTYVLVAGFVFQSGPWDAPMPWLLSVPIFFAVHTAIILSSLPDYHADRAVSKNTVTVLLGPQGAAMIAFMAAIAAISSASLLVYNKIIVACGLLLLAITISHALILLFAIARIAKQRRFNCRIDGTMQIALSYILWFGIIPLSCLLWN